MENQPFVFIKPHAFHNREAIEFIEKLFEKSGIHWLKKGVITGAEIRAGALVDKHYSVNARVGTIRQPALLEIGDAGKQKFKAYFGEEWDAVIAQNRMCSGLVLQEKLGGNADQVNEVWSASSKRTKVAGGHYVAYSSALNLYILNGFYPMVRDRYMADEASILFGIIRFSSSELEWKSFRHEVIGVTNPAEADKSSVRGYLYAHASAFKINVDNGDNVIHASASPFEALIEKNLWLSGFDLSGDPLYTLLHKSGMDMAFIRKQYEKNPVVALKTGEAGTLLDVLEDKNTDRVAEILIELFNDGNGVHS